jgi:hypothetical protein
MNHIFLGWGTSRLLSVSGYMSKAALNIVEYMTSWYCGASFGYMPRRSIAGSWCKSILNFLRKHQIDFQSVCTSWHSYPQWKNVPLTPQPLQHVLLLEFLILVILTYVRCHPRVILICIFLRIKDVEHFFKCFSAIWNSSIENSV